MKPLSLEGQKFGRLTVICRGQNNKYGKATWLCQCECGVAKTVISSKLTNGETKSCGCKRVENGRLNKTHGASYSALYNRYKAMLNRCHNPNNSSFERYGGKGIRVCDRWRHSYAAFYEDMGEPPPGFTLDRIDNSKGYSPENCRWASTKQQANNSSKARIITFNGKSMNVTEWAKFLGMTQGALSERLEKWPVEKALTLPKRR